jgi:hypothetical protein
LIVTGVLLLVGALVLAYKHSDRFRAIVDKAMAVAKAGVAAVVNGFQALGAAVLRVMQTVARVVTLYVKAYALAFQLGYKAAAASWKAISDAVTSVVGAIGGKVTSLRDKVTASWQLIRDKGEDAFRALIAPIQRIVDLVDSLIDRIKDIHVPHIDLNPLNGRTVLPSSQLAAAGGGDTVNLTLNVTPAVGTTSGQATIQAQAMMNAIDARLILVGRKPVFRRA